MWLDWKVVTKLTIQSAKGPKNCCCGSSTLSFFLFTPFQRLENKRIGKSMRKKRKEKERGESGNDRLPSCRHSHSSSHLPDLEYGERSFCYVKKKRGNGESCESGLKEGTTRHCYLSFLPTLFFFLWIYSPRSPWYTILLSLFSPHTSLSLSLSLK